MSLWECSESGGAGSVGPVGMGSGISRIVKSRSGGERSSIGKIKTKVLKSSLRMGARRLRSTSKSVLRTRIVSVLDRHVRFVSHIPCLLNEDFLVRPLTNVLPVQFIGRSQKVSSSFYSFTFLSYLSAHCMGLVRHWKSQGKVLRLQASDLSSSRDIS